MTTDTVDTAAKTLAQPSPVAAAAALVVVLSVLVVVLQISGAPTPPLLMDAYRLCLGLFAALSGASHFVTLWRAKNGSS